MPALPVSKRLFAVVVAYRCNLQEIKAWPFLREVALARRGDCPGSTFALEQILLVDNSPDPRARPEEHLPSCSYVHDPGNGGTAAAYAHAWAMARDAGADWLLLLDQDTELPAGFLETACAALDRSDGTPGALVPRVFHDRMPISPARVTRLGTILPVAERSAQPSGARITAIASGSLVHVPTLSAILPFPPRLWLDYVDHWMFAKIRNSRRPIVVFDARLQHDLSVLRIGSLSANRLTSILDGEASFVAELGLAARLVHPLRLAARVARYARTRPELAWHTLSWITHRVTRRN